MGSCLSKKKGPPTPAQTIPNETPNEKKMEERKVKEKEAVASQEAEAVVAEKKPVFVITQSKKPSPSSSTTTSEEKDSKKGETPKKKIQLDGERSGGGVVAVAVEEVRPTPVRTSSCTKEEVDAILIQCGRLSRSSSGKASNETSGVRKYSGSKRSYDFDEDKRRGDDEWEKPVSRPSPHRRTPSRERDGEYKRSGSRERGSGSGGRRVSRSPGRRSDGPTPCGSSGDRLKQPGKMVSVPAREKGGATAAESFGVGVKRATPAASKLRSQSPRSQSPANARASNENASHSHPSQPQPQSLSRSSSRKAEQSPYRRNPMAELDENSLGEEQHPVRKTSQSQPQKGNEGVAQARKLEQRYGGAGEIPCGIKSNNAVTNCVREQLMSYRTKEQPPEPEIVEESAEAKGVMKGIEVPFMGAEGLNPRTMTRTRSSRRSSRDLDHCLGLNPETLLKPNSYNSLQLEGIHNYHQQNTAFSLPACVSKACSILEAVADLNSTFSDNKSYEGERSNNDNALLNGRLGKKGLVPKEPFMESEIVVKDDLMEPSLHKYVTVRGLVGEMEPQESAGSNSFIGQPWASPWGLNSVDSTDQCWTSRSNNAGEEFAEEEDLSPQDQQQQHLLPDGRARRLRSGSSATSLPAGTMSSGRKREFVHRQLHHGGSGGAAVGAGKIGGRALSVPVAAAAAAAASS